MIQPFSSLPFKFGPFHARVGRKSWQNGIPKNGPHGTTLGDDRSIDVGFRDIGEHFGHVGWPLEPMLPCNAFAIFGSNRCPLGDAHQNVVRLIDAWILKMNVIGPNQWQAQSVSKGKQRGFNPSLIGKAVTLQFHIQSVIKQRSQLL